MKNSNKIQRQGTGEPSEKRENRKHINYNNLYSPEQYAVLEGLPERVRYLRKELAGMTQEQLTERMGFKSTQTISNYETGERSPRMGTIEKLARVLSDKLDFVVLPEYIAGKYDYPNSMVESLAIFHDKNSPAILIQRILGNDERVTAIHPSAEATTNQLRASWKLNYAMSGTFGGELTESDLNEIMDYLRDQLVFQLWNRATPEGGREAIITRKQLERLAELENMRNSAKKNEAQDDKQEKSESEEA